MFGKPSALYSNMPPPAPTPTTDDLVGVVEQTGGAKETPQEKAARERAEMATEGKL